jgi:hypothetical protein
MRCSAILLLSYQVSAAHVPAFPLVYSASRTINEPTGHYSHQIGYVQSNYVKGEHVEARSIDNVTYDETRFDTTAQKSWTVWRDVKTLNESRPCTAFSYHPMIAQNFFTDATHTGQETVNGVLCDVWSGTFQGPSPEPGAKVFAAATDSTHILRIDLQGLFFLYTDWRTGASAKMTGIPKDCPA